MKNLIISALLAMSSSFASAEQIGAANTSINLLGSNDRIVIEAFDDPKVPGVTCHLSRAVKGGMTADFGLASDKTEASIACRQIGPISFPRPLTDGESVFEVKMSLLFKTMHVVRFFDKKRNVLIYLVYSDKLIDGSPKNSISTVPVQKW